MSDRVSAVRRKTQDLLLGSWELIQQLGRVPPRLISNNEGTEVSSRTLVWVAGSSHTDHQREVGLAKDVGAATLHI